MNTQAARRGLIVVTLLLAFSACDAGEAGSNGKLRASIELSDEATPADVGLPKYPGARLFQESGDSSSGANLGIATPMFGFKVAAVTLQSADRPERVADFYRRALSKYGNVLECSEATRGKTPATADGDGLVCKPGESDDHTVVYKAGTEKNLRIVAIKPRGHGTQFDLVRVDMRGEER